VLVVVVAQVAQIAVQVVLSQKAVEIVVLAVLPQKVRKHPVENSINRSRISWQKENGV
ncbi:MAG TPA: hypothetical protein HA304_03000, partial [Methanosarcinales archaeon]|nr:hypothetical protein [Methanosarcinales archaeon]